jgi:hypothetical protein
MTHTLLQLLITTDLTVILFGLLVLYARVDSFY